MLGKRTVAILFTAASLLWAGAAAAAEGESARSLTYDFYPPAPAQQSSMEADAKSAGCVSCHTTTDQKTMHQNPAVVLGCADCHGGNAGVMKPAGADRDDREYFAAQEQAHVLPLLPETWHYPHSGNPKRIYAAMNREAPEYIRFVNPSDYRVADQACGACHMPQIEQSKRSLMSTGAMLWGGGTYNNGILPFKNYVLGEGYAVHDHGKHKTVGAAFKSLIPEDATPEFREKLRAKGVLDTFIPLPAFEATPGADVFRVFERGGRNILNLFPEIGLPNALGQLQRLEEPGRPDLRQSNRGPGTGLRVAVPALNITKTRLNDPFLWFLGTNDQPGDFRTSGCGACHIVYANDRDPRHSGPYAKSGHWGRTQTADPTISREEIGHPLKHEFTRAIPTSLCMTCHMHQPNIFLNSYLGYTMWDYESDAPAMWPKEQKYPTMAEEFEILERNPEEAAIRGKWGDLEFLSQVWEMNPDLEHTQFADYHGHGWNFRAIQKRDRKGNMLDADGKVVASDDPKKWEKTVHMSSIHLDVGMHCVDCHFQQDAHGNGYIYGEVANAIEIRCKDCHGTADAYPPLRTSGPAARPGGFPLDLLRAPDGRARFQWRGTDCGKPADQQLDCALYQRPSLWGTDTPEPEDAKIAAALGSEREWKVSLVKDSVTPGHGEYNAKAARAKLMSRGTDMEWGKGAAPTQAERAHPDDEMECFTCHLSWTTSCAGCHLPIQANRKTVKHHYEDEVTRNFATYNPQVARDQMFQLGIHQTTKGNTVAPIRSTSALILSSQNINRERIYIQQPPVSASGYSSQAFAPHFPHTVRLTETKTCTDCHLSEENDNNAIMAQLLLHGTNFVNFVGAFSYVGGDGGLEAVRVTEYDEPQAVIGSYLQRYAYPDWYADHQARDRKLFEAFTQPGNRTGCIQHRGEYLFASEGSSGMRAYDIASIANKGFSDRIITAPFGPWGHDTHIPSKNATCVVLPTNQPIHPDRQDSDELTKALMLGVNQEQPFHAIYDYAFITDAEEGLILTDVNTLQDGEPRNNFLTRALTWNPGGVLNGARHLTIAGYYFYVTTPRGVVVLNMDQPLEPKVVAELPFTDARATALQFRYLFVTDAEGLKVVDVTHPERPKPIAGAGVPLADARRIYLARTYAYVAAGSQGLAIVDITKADAPALYQLYDADGRINDAQDVVVASTNASAYAYVADGRNGLKVISLTAPDRQPNFYGFSPEPKPDLIAWWPTSWPALSLSKGLDRDRGVDETGGQIAVFGRLGSRPFTLEEQRRLFMDENGEPWFVTDEVEQDKLVPQGSDKARAAERPGADGKRAEAPAGTTVR